MKRIRKYPDCPNPLFEKWLEEWKMEAMERESPIQHLFGKALTSLRKYPLPLSSGRECYILQNFGQKLCSMLDKKLVQYNKLYKIPSNSAQNNLPYNNDVQNRQKEMSENESNESKKIKENRKIPTKSYVPKIGSSSYAILIAMYKNMKKLNSPGFMYKKDIISQAQNECNCSMKKRASERYTGWSCMSLLISKDLVVKKSNPAKYSLTDAGFSLAMSLMKAKESLSSDCSDEDTELNDILKNVQNSPNKSTSPLKSIYSQSKSPEKSFNNFNFKNDDFEKSPEHLNSGNDLSCSINSLSPIKNVPKAIKENDIITIDDDDDDDDDDDVEVFKCNLMQNNDDERINFEKVTRKEYDVKDIKSTDNSFHKFCKDNAESLITEVQSEYNIKRKKIDEKEKRKENFTEDVTTASQNKIEFLAEDTSTESFYLLPNNFDIILLVDIQETSGSKTKRTDDTKTSELSKSGILFEVRSLKVGDFTWIARCRFTNRELVLPYIVERKRMDDFSSSIKDGRYHEQKFRLSQSGIRNVIYMIESYGKNYHGSIPITSLFQAAMNSLVQDNFSVKFTNDHKHSMHYLATVTTMLTEIYEAKELKCCKKKDLPMTNPNISEGTELLMEFTEFNKAAVKTKNFSVEKMFLRQLLQLKGLSVEKALAIVQLYPTPKCLTEALKNADENLLANIVTKPMKRKIGPSISKTIYQLYTRYNFN